MSGETTIWVMDSDCCEMCNGLLDYFGQCPHCGWDSVYGYSLDDVGYEEEFGEKNDWDGWYDDLEEMQTSIECVSPLALPRYEKPKRR